MFTRVGNFFIDQWLWNITWDWYHIPITIFFMVLFFRFFLRINSIAAVLIALSSIGTALIVYTGFVVGVLMYIGKFAYQESLQGQSMVADPLHACVYVGLIYTVLQSIFFIVLHRYYPINRLKMIGVTAIANMLAAGIIYLTLPNPLM